MQQFFWSIGHSKSTSRWWFAAVHFGNVEYHRLMQIVETDLAKQLERIREMERNGELAPAPGVEINH